MTTDPLPKPKRRPRRLRARPRPLTVAQILGWADAHQRRTGHWPKKDSGPVHDAAGETWCAIHLALNRGSRGLFGHSSLAQLLAEHRGVRNHLGLSDLSPEQILGWADAYHARTGCWPTDTGELIPEAPNAGDTWHHIDVALRMGNRGLPGGSSLPRLLAEARGVRNRKGLQCLTVAQVLAWADAHQQRTGHWPRADSGPVAEVSGETWALIDSALNKRLRGWRGPTSLARLLERHRGVRNRRHLPPLRIEEILRWADAHRARTGRWPQEKSGPVTNAPGETWAGVCAALRIGIRGLPGGTTLFRLLGEHRSSLTGQG